MTDVILSRNLHILKNEFLIALPFNRISTEMMFYHAFMSRYLENDTVPEIPSASIS